MGSKHCFMEVCRTSYIMINKNHLYIYIIHIYYHYFLSNFDALMVQSWREGKLWSLLGVKDQICRMFIEFFWDSRWCGRFAWSHLAGPASFDCSRFQSFRSVLRWRGSWPFAWFLSWWPGCFNADAGGGSSHKWTWLLLGTFPRCPQRILLVHWFHSRCVSSWFRCSS